MNGEMRRHGGARALEQSNPRDGAAGNVHSARRGERPHHPDRRMDSCARRAAKPPPGRGRWASRSIFRRSSFAMATCPGLVLAVLLETGLAARPAGARDHRGGVGRGFFARGIYPEPAQGARNTHRHGRFRHGIFLPCPICRRFPFDKIKIDQSFISNVGTNAQSAAIVRAVIGLARGLKLPVLAEGVEYEDQLAFLAEEDCDEVAGIFRRATVPDRPLCRDDRTAPASAERRTGARLKARQRRAPFPRREGAVASRRPPIAPNRAPRAWPATGERA